MEDLKKSTKIIHPGLWGVQIGPQRCIPSRSLSQRWQNRGFLQSSALRSYSSSLDVLEGVKIHQERTEVARHNNHIIPGRFVDPSAFQTGSISLNTDSDRGTPGM